MTAFLLAATLLVSPAVSQMDPVEWIQMKVTALDEALDAAQRDALHIDFGDEARTDWSFFPGDRAGLWLADLDAAQQELVFAVVQACLSESGFDQAESIRLLEDVLHAMENNNPGRDKTRYALAVFGTPGREAPWGVRWEGHHISLNWTIVDGKIVASTPQFFGSNPGEVPHGPKQGFRALAAEEDLARQLLAALDADQRATAIIHDKAPSDILTRMQTQAGAQKDAGLAFGDMTEAQQGVLLQLIETYARVQLPLVHEARMAEVRAGGLEHIKFAWMGGTEKGEGHYYRIQGPEFLIEYDNTQNNANHPHCVWRDFEGDFGRDVLKTHYEAAH